MSARLVLGLNQYTHSASACLLDEQGEIVGALEKERITRRKHDGGDTAAVVEALLEQHGVALEDIALVVANNHLFRIRPFEERLAFGPSHELWSEFTTELLGLDRNEVTRSS